MGREFILEKRGANENSLLNGNFKGLKLVNFKFSEKTLQNEINDSLMHIHVQESGSLHNITEYSPDHLFTINMTVNRITLNSQRSKSSVRYTNYSVKMSKRELKEGKWLKVNITKLVNEYLSRKSDTLTVTIKIQELSNRIGLKVPHPKAESSNAWMPYIELFIQDDSHKRTRRTLLMDCEESVKEKRCCRYPLVVDFEELGFDFVLAPKQYRAYYCSGECPYSYLQQYTHTQLVRFVNPPGSSGPCCGPRKVSGISMLYFDHDENIILGNLPGMVVESCGCT